MWPPSSSTTKRSRFFQVEIFLRISSTDISSRDKITLLAKFISHPSVNFLLQRVPYAVIHWVTVWTLWRPFILFDEFWCSLLQMGLGHPTCVRRGPILLKYIIVSGINSPTIWEKIVIQQLNVVFTINLGSISVNKMNVCFSFP